MDDVIQTMLCISTGHVTSKTMEKLLECDFDWLSVYQKQSTYGPVYGVFICVDSVSLDSYAETADIPDDLMAVLKYAQGIGASWVMLDRDYDEIDGLPTYNW